MNVTSLGIKVPQAVMICVVCEEPWKQHHVFKALVVAAVPKKV